MARPPKYTTEALREAVNDYLYSEDRTGVLTKSGLLLHLDITRQTYSRWKEDEHKFSDTLKKAELVIEEAWVQALRGNNVAGTIFYLKNAFKEDYKDRHETDLTSKGERIMYATPEELSHKYVPDSHTTSSSSSEGQS